MLHKETVEKGTLDLIRKLMADDQLKEFNLVGGTALALKLGHRKSIDIDLFSTGSFNAPELARYLTSSYNTDQLRTITNGIFGFIDDIKIDLLSHQYPLVSDLEIVEGIRMVSFLDIGGMKLNAVYNSGARLKDFVDVHTLLEVFSLEQMAHACEQKYPDININMVKNVLLYHDDIDFSMPIDYTGKKIKWPDIADRIKKAFHNPQLIFSKLPAKTRDLLEKKPRKRHGRGKGPRL